MLFGSLSQLKIYSRNSSSPVEQTDDLHYRLRVVDLIESLAKSRSANPHLVLVLLPLFSIVRGSATVEQELQSKAAKLLRQIVSGRKDSPAPEDPQSALDALEELHVVSQTVDSADLATLCSQTSIYLAKAALASPAADAGTSASIAKLFGDSFELYLSKKNSKTRVQPALTIEFGRRLPTCAWPLFKTVVALAGGAETAVNAYRRMQAFEVAQALLTSYAALVRSSLPPHLRPANVVGSRTENGRNQVGHPRRPPRVPRRDLRRPLLLPHRHLVDV